jgi:hypothetical protein
MKMKIECEITDPDVMGAIFALLGKQSPCDLTVHMERATDPEEDPDVPIPYVPADPATVVTMTDPVVTATPEPVVTATPEPRVVITPSPPAPVADNPLAEETPAPEPAKKRGRPQKGGQTVLPSGPVNADRYMDALNAARSKWGVDAVRGILRELSGKERPQEVPEDLWPAVVDACNAYTGGGAIDMTEFL